MKYYVDTEFIDDGHTIDLVSIGIACEDGRELYLQSCEFNPKNASQWVKDNVFVCLAHCPHVGSYDLSTVLHQHKKGQCVDQQRGLLHRCPWRTRDQLSHAVLSFLEPHAYGKPEFIGWCSGCDWVALYQLFGTMMDLPYGYPHYIKDLQQILDERGLSDEDVPKQEDGLHNALADARHIKRIWESLHV